MYNNPLIKQIITETFADLEKESDQSSKSITDELTIEGIDEID